MPKFKPGDEVLVPATVIATDSHGAPIVAFRAPGDRLAYTPHRLVVPDAIPAPKPVEYEFTFSITATRPVVVRAISESAARQRVDDILSEDVGEDHQARFCLEEVTLDGDRVDEWQR